MQSSGGKEDDGRNDSASRKYFALLPKRMKNGKWIWLKHYRRAPSLFK